MNKPLRILLLAAAVLAAALSTRTAERMAVTSDTGTTTNIIRLYSLTLSYSDDTNVNLIAIGETVRHLSVLPSGEIVDKGVETRQWDYDTITNISLSWTNSMGGVFTNNLFRNRLLVIWTNLNQQPEFTAFRYMQPNVVAPNVEP